MELKSATPDPRKLLSIRRQLALTFNGRTMDLAVERPPHSPLRLERVTFEQPPPVKAAKVAFGSELCCWQRGLHGSRSTVTFDDVLGFLGKIGFDEQSVLTNREALFKKKRGKKLISVLAMTLTVPSSDRVEIHLTAGDWPATYQLEKFKLCLDPFFERLIVRRTEADTGNVVDRWWPQLGRMFTKSMIYHGNPASGKEIRVFLKHVGFGTAMIDVAEAHLIDDARATLSALPKSAKNRNHP